MEQAPLQERNGLKDIYKVAALDKNMELKNSTTNIYSNDHTPVILK